MDETAKEGLSATLPAMKAGEDAAGVHGEVVDDGMAERAMQIMRRVRARLVTDHPFFGDLALRLNFRVDHMCGDIWTDGRTMAFNPLYCTTLNEDKLLGAQAHEVLHLVFGHHLRRRGREKKLWNKACDMAINGILVDAGFSLPDGFYYDAALVGMSADEIYDELVARMARSREKSLLHQGRPDPEGASDAHPEHMSGKKEDMLGRRSPNEGTGATEQGEQEERSRQRGRGVVPIPGMQNQGRPGQDEAPRFDGEVRDLPELEARDGQEDARSEAERDAEVALTQAVSRARRMGTLPAGLEREVERVDAGTLDWQEILQRFLSACADNDYTWTTPNRRYIFQEIYMPSRWEQRLNHVVIAVDTSGSVDMATLSLFMSELARVLDSFDTRLTVLFHDTKVQKMETVTRAELPDALMPVGGGGTDFRPIPKEIEDHGIMPVCLIWFSDLECTRFPEEPDYPVLWIAPRKGGEEPPFGEVVYMNPRVRD